MRRIKTQLLHLVGLISLPYSSRHVLLFPLFLYYSLTNQLTNQLRETEFFLKCNTSSAGQEIPHFSRHIKVHHRGHKDQLQPYPKLGHTDPFLSFRFFKIHFYYLLFNNPCLGTPSPSSFLTKILYMSCFFPACATRSAGIINLVSITLMICGERYKS